VVNNLDGSPEVLRNELPDHGNWLLVKLTGKGWNTDAIGALVTARAGTMTGIRLVQSGTSYLSQHDMRLHFGLGAATDVDSLEVRWPDGTTTTVQHVKANQIVNIQQPR
jgi:enediyne biosynthesis protein E4